ncbi:dynein axonemal assembly factor 4-like [Schistocerca serialis cubense]|uniref:dynein axonemal assembly factor 4-like n=1 Tax=Schistocerca serialis cubense TaxID=2023355 RepID=UPI00214EA55B|nr:dynein axonemal assembly factor 4-like [Schistocerca serialis cubense]
MPILVTDYDWRQTEAVVIIKVRLRNVNSKNVDIFTLDKYIKAHYPPFLFEVFLWAPVKNSESNCTLTNTEIIFELQKLEHKIWESLEASVTKEEKQKLRQQYVTEALEIAEKEKERNSKKRHDFQQLAVRQQIALDTQERTKIEEIKNNERTIAMRDLQQWKDSASMDAEDFASKKKQLNSVKEQSTKQKIFVKGESKDKKCINNKNVSDEKEYKEANSKKIFRSEIPKPAPRKPGKIHVSFTPRVFPTPKRESQEKEEQEWLKKQYEARKNVGFVEEDLLPEEKDPDWLKQKGDSFFQMGNYLGAISAYSHAINLGFKMAALYSNRAAAHLAVGNVHKAIEDCSEALELLTPHVSMNAEARACCHARRAAALCRLGLLPQGLADLEAALQLQPENEKLWNDMKLVKKAIESQTQETSSDDD